MNQRFDYAYKVNSLKREKVPLKVHYKSTRPFTHILHLEIWLYFNYSVLNYNP